MVDFEIKSKGKFTYIEEGPEDGDVIVLLHGLFGTASNFDETIRAFKDGYRVYLPILPIFDMSVRKLSVYALAEFVKEFTDYFELENIHLVGNSLGGHLALLYVLNFGVSVRSMTLTGSSGLYESAFGNSFPRRGDRDFIRNKINLTFYDKDTVTEEMVEEVYGITSDRIKCLKMVKTAKSAIRHNVGGQLGDIKIPSLLVWGKQDTITPPMVAEEFHEKLSNSKLVLIDKCGHAPMLETPDEFNLALKEFLLEL